MFKYAESLPFGLEIVSDTVVKKTGQFSLIESLDQTRRVVKHFIKHPDPMVVPVYEWQEFSNKNSKGWFEYSYTMKRMCVLSDLERSLITQSIYRFRHRKIFNISIFEEGKELYPDLAHFVNEVLLQNKYWDVHNGNFLKDEVGDYKLIDVEGFLIFPVDRRDLSWISKEDEDETS